MNDRLAEITSGGNVNDEEWDYSASSVNLEHVGDEQLLAELQRRLTPAALPAVVESTRLHIALWGIHEGAIQALWQGFYTPQSDLSVTFEDGPIKVSGFNVQRMSS